MLHWWALWHRITMFLLTAGKHSGVEIQAVYHQVQERMCPSLAGELLRLGHEHFTIRRGCWEQLPSIFNFFSFQDRHVHSGDFSRHHIHMCSTCQRKAEQWHATHSHIYQQNYQLGLHLSGQNLIASPDTGWLTLSVKPVSPLLVWRNCSSLSLLMTPHVLQWCSLILIHRFWHYRSQYNWVLQCDLLSEYQWLRWKPTKTLLKEKPALANLFSIECALAFPYKCSLWYCDSRSHCS